MPGLLVVTQAKDITQPPAAAGPRTQRCPGPAATMVLGSRTGHPYQPPSSSPSLPLLQSRLSPLRMNHSVSLSPFSTVEFLITVVPVPGGPVGVFHLTPSLFSFEITFIHKTLYKWVRHTEINLYIDMYDYNFRAIDCIIKKNDMPSMLSFHKSEHFVPFM